jgi:hypothetical protein
MTSTETEASPEEWALAWEDYETGRKPAREIAASLKLTRSAFYKETRRRGWARRNPHLATRQIGRKLRRRNRFERAASASPLPGTAGSDAAVRSGPRGEAEALLERLLRLLARRMDALEADGADPERTDSRLVQTARIAAQIRAELVKLGKHAPLEAAPDDVHPARSINELRDELFRHLERVRERARRRRLPRDADPG